MLFDQKEIWQELQNFLKITGLKSYWIADKCGIPRDVLYAFRSGKRSLPEHQGHKLATFMKEYRANNSNYLSLEE